MSDPVPEYQDGVRRAVGALVDYALDGMATGGHWRAPVPAAAAEQARRAALSGIGMGLVIRRYVAAHARLGEYVVEQAAECGLAHDGSTLLQLRRVQEILLERLTAAIEQEYVSASDGLDHAPAQRRALIVGRLLSGDPVAQAELASLDYQFDRRWHIGVLIEGTRSFEALRTLRAGLGCDLLSVTPQQGPSWVWLGAERLPSIARIDERLDVHPPARLSLGEPGLGVEGWRRTHLEALAAWPIALHRSGGAVRCADVTLDAALLSNDVLAALHRQIYLAPLDDLRNGGRTARETLRAYFTCDGSIASTSARLNVTRRTVENRLHQIASSLHRPLSDCLPEIEVALRLEAFAAETARHEDQTLGATLRTAP